jgi:hypothetical protein
MDSRDRGYAEDKLLGRVQCVSLIAEDGRDGKQYIPLEKIALIAL